jgi:predicted ATP-grasp superfamily ATP-dependent carboligase
VEDIQVRAVNSLVSAVRMCYRMVVDVERLELELERLREENKRAEEAREEQGYEVEG